MLTVFSRRKAFQLAGATALAQPLFSFQQTPADAQSARIPRQEGDAPLAQDDPFPENNLRPTVSIIKGENRRKNVHDSLLAIDDKILPVLKTKKYVTIKPNIVYARQAESLSATHPDELHGILDYLAPRFKGPIQIAESSAGDTLKMYEVMEYAKVVDEHKDQKVTLVDLNREDRIKILPIINYHIHPVPIRLAGRLFDPDNFNICAAVMKTHNTLVATLSIKNMVVGAPLHFVPGDSTRWNDKRKIHAGIRQTNYIMYQIAEQMKPFWGATVIDAFEGMEGNGPGAGTPVPHRIALASTDYVAADRVGVEVMGIDPSYLGYLQYLGDAGVGQYDLSKIAIEGEKIAAVKREYRMHNDIERELLWRGPMEELPPNVGWTRPLHTDDVTV